MLTIVAKCCILDVFGTCGCASTVSVIPIPSVLVPEPKTTYPHNFVTLLPCVMLMLCEILVVM